MAADQRVSRRVYFVTHPDVVVDPSLPVPRWPLSERGRERMRRLLLHPWVAELSAVFASTEQKAIDGASILAHHLGIRFEAVETLGENDRSSTGFLPPAEFQAVANEFFARPSESVRGWERARDAQARIAGAVLGLAERLPAGASMAVVSHGGVGALLLCHLRGVAISRAEEQPGTSGGHYFVFDHAPSRLVHGWRPID